MIDEETVQLAHQIIHKYRKANMTIRTAESCTGGLLFASLTDVSGASAVMDQGWVTYSNAAKASQLGVENEILARFGAVSTQTADAMVRGALDGAARNCIAVSVTGIAGPMGGTCDKPVGTVIFGIGMSYGNASCTPTFFGELSRRKIRCLSVRFALELLRDHLPFMDI